MVGHAYHLEKINLETDAMMGKSGYFGPEPSKQSSLNSIL